MKRFVLKLRFFIVILLLMWLGAESFYRFVPNNYTVKHKNLQEAYNDTQMLILGNSHAFYGIAPEMLSIPAFNLANVSQSLLYDKLLFDKHIDSLKQLKYVVVNVEYTSLSQKDRQPDLEWRKYFYESQMELNTGMVSGFDIKKYSLALAPRFRLTLNSFGKYIEWGTLAECTSKGWRKREGINYVNNNPQAGRNVAFKHEDGSLDFKKNIERLKQIIESCHRRNVKVILVTMPVSSYYAVNVNKAKLNKIFSECTALTVSYNNVSYLNLFQDKRFVNSDFYDTDHLNASGAKKCSEILDRYIAAIP